MGLSVRRPLHHPPGVKQSMRWVMVPLVHLHASLHTPPLALSRPQPVQVAMHKLPGAMEPRPAMALQRKLATQ